MFQNRSVLDDDDTLTGHEERRESRVVVHSRAELERNRRERHATERRSKERRPARA